jgi:hypothetical protein
MVAEQGDREDDDRKGWDDHPHGRAALVRPRIVGGPSRQHQLIFGLGGRRWGLVRIFDRHGVPPNSVSDLSETVRPAAKVQPLTAQARRCIIAPWVSQGMEWSIAGAWR